MWINSQLLVLLFPFLLVLSFYLDKTSPHKNGNKPKLRTPRQIPVLCYHNIYRRPPKEDLLWISTLHFEQQIKQLYDSGYHAILPDDLYQHFVTGIALPAKSFIITFDDAHEQHFSLVAPILNKYHFKAVFFITTSYIGKRYYLNAGQIKALADWGHIIGCHTYDHSVITSLKIKELELQIDISKSVLEKITAKPIEYFAYPYGVWNNSAVSELMDHGFKGAFQLSGNSSTSEPLFTLRRMMVSGQWSPGKLEIEMEKCFIK